MERLVQSLDVIEDAMYAIALLAERIRNVVWRLCIIAVTLFVGMLGAMLAISFPPGGLALAALLAVFALYRSALYRSTIANTQLDTQQYMAE